MRFSAWGRRGLRGVEAVGSNPNVVLNATKYGMKAPGRFGRTLFYDAGDNVTVVVTPGGEVVTVYPGMGPGFGP